MTETMTDALPGALPPPPPPKRSGCGRALLWLAVVGMAVALLAVVAVLAVAVAAACGGGSGGAVDKTLRLREKVIVSGDAKRRVAVIPVRGTIDGTGGPLDGTGMAHQVGKRLRAAANDPTVMAVVLDVDSGGGGLTASDVIYNEVLRLRAAHKTVVAAVGSMAASGGYYVIAPADHIVVQPTGMVGSFGVIMEHVEVSELMKKLGIAVEPVKSTARKDIGSPFRPMTPEEKRFFEKILGSYHQRFVEIIAKGRKLAPDAVAALATGEVYTATEAKAHGLVDAIGYFDDALAFAREAIGRDNAQAFVYEEAVSFQSMMEALSGRAFLPGRLLGELGGPRLRAE